MTTTSMLLLRNAQHSDLESIHQLAIESGIGITTLPKDIDTLRNKLELSINSIKLQINHPHYEYYLFVLENPLTHEIVGTSAIKSTLSHSGPSFTYKLFNRTRVSHAINKRHEEKWLLLVNDFQNQSELCTLYLKPDYRHSHHGVFLSRARFLFIAQHPTRFENNVIAEMRGVTYENGHSPFWDSLGQHYFQMSFQQADELTVTTNKQFISDLLPEYPVPVLLLNQEAQKVIGKPHPATEPAMHILLNEGFRYSNYVDIFDAGPILEAERDHIATIKSSLTAPVVDIVDELDSEQKILSNTPLHFRAAMGPIVSVNNGVVINKLTAQLLQMNKGDVLRYASL